LLKSFFAARIDCQPPFLFSQLAGKRQTQPARSTGNQSVLHFYL
jgi:hypothetical protein